MLNNNYGSNVIPEFSSEREFRDFMRSAIKAKSTNKITNWAKEPTVDFLLTDLKNASSAHSEAMSKIDKWLKTLNTKNDKNKLKQGRSGISPKVGRRMAEWRYSSLASAILNERNIFNVVASNPKYIDASIQNSLLLNFQFNNQINKVQFVNSLVRTLVNEGTAIVRIGWDVEQKVEEEKVPVYNYVQATPEEALSIQQILTQIAQEQQQTGVESSSDTETYKSLDPVMQESIKASTEYPYPVIAVDTRKKQTIKRIVESINKPSVKVINNNDLIIDPTCEGDFSKARFVIYKYQTDLSTLRNINQKVPNTYYNLDKLLKNDLLKNIDSIPTGSTNSSEFIDSVFRSIESEYFDRNSNFIFQDDARKKLIVYEYWGYYDIDDTGVAQGIVVSICNNTIIRMERNPFPDGGLPFVVIPYMPVKDSIYGEPDISLIEDNQAIARALTRAMVDITARSANGQIGFPKGFLDVVNKKKYDSGQDFEYNLTTNMHPAQAVYTRTSAEIPQSMMALLQNQYIEAESMIGVKSYLGGMDNTAYGQKLAGSIQSEAAFNQREVDIIFRISKGLEEIGLKILKMNAEWLNEEEAIAITNSEYITINRKDLGGNFYLQVQLKSNSESQGKANQLAFIAQTLGENADWNLRKLIYLEIGKLYNLDGFITALQNYEPQPDPIQQQLMQLEVEYKQAQIANLQAKVKLDLAKSEYIDEQTDNVSADTDLKYQDYINTEDGTKHRQNLENITAQAYAQNQGKIATELLKAKHSLNKSKLDNVAKLLQEQEKAKNRINEKNSNSSGLIHKPRGGLNPELGALPPELNRINNIGNYMGSGLVYKQYDK